MRLGLTKHCQIIYGRPEICVFPRLSCEWLLTLILISCGILCLTVTCVLQLVSHWRRFAIKYARWIAFTASKYRPIRCQHCVGLKCTNLPPLCTITSLVCRACTLCKASELYCKQFHQQLLVYS